MSFHIGQRVRLVRPRKTAEPGNRLLKLPKGHLGVVAEIVDGEVGCFWDGHEDEIAWGKPSQIEPIRDDDTNTVVSWESCLWKPAQVKA